jgi:hypothetical protein
MVVGVHAAHAEDRYPLGEAISSVAVTAPISNIGTANAPNLKLVPAAAAPTCAIGGDSIAGFDGFSVPPGYNYQNAYFTGTGGASIIGWFDAISKHGCTIDPTKYGYVGSSSGVAYAMALTGGAGLSPSTAISINFNTPSGSTAPGSILVTTTAAGTIPTGIEFPELSASAQSSGFSSQPTIGLSIAATGANAGYTVAPTWVSSITGTGTWGDYGDTSAGWLMRVQLDACAKPVDFMINNIGTNDITAGVAEATIVANMQATIQAEIGCGMIPVWIGIPPRSSGWSATYDKERNHVNLAMSKYIRTQIPPSLLGIPGAFYVDLDHYWEDPTSASGAPLSTLLVDGLHPSGQGAELAALAICEQICRYLPPNIYQPQNVNDVYDATNNPAGNLLLNASGQMSGTGGTANSNCTTSSGVASGWTLSGGSSGTSVSCVGTIETARTDGLPGRRQVVTITDNSGATQKYGLSNYNNYADVSSGDAVYMTAEIDVSNIAGVEYVGCVLAENGTSPIQEAVALNSGNASASAPILTDAQVAKLEARTLFPDIGLTDIAAASSVANLQAAGSYRISCRTPPITLQAGITYPTPQIIAKLTGSSSSVTLKIGTVAIRKMVN